MSSDAPASSKTRLLLPGAMRPLAKTAAEALDPSRYVTRRAPFDSPEIAWCDAAFPLGLQDQLLLRAFFPGLSGKKYLCPSIPVMRICANKMLFAAFMEENGFAAFVPPATAAPGGRALIKPRIAAGGKGARLAEPSDRPGPGFVSQAWIESGVEYAAHLVFDGAVRFCQGVAYTKAERSQIKLTPSDTPMQAVAVPGPILAVFSRVLTRLGFVGICCIDYLVVDDRPVILEINPRLGSSIVDLGLAELVDAYCRALPGRDQGASGLRR